MFILLKYQLFNREIRIIKANVASYKQKFSFGYTRFTSLLLLVKVVGVFLITNFDFYWQIKINLYIM